ncbi:hypothetical protein Tco_0431752 [Tanacetum coccineum]
MNAVLHWSNGIEQTSLTISCMLKCFFWLRVFKSIFKSNYGNWSLNEEVLAAANIMGVYVILFHYRYLIGVRVGLSLLGERFTVYEKVEDKTIDASFVASFRRNPRGGVKEEQFTILVELVGFIFYLFQCSSIGHGLLGSSGRKLGLYGLKLLDGGEIDIPIFLSVTNEWIAFVQNLLGFSKAQKEMLEGVFYVIVVDEWKFRNQVLFGFFFIAYGASV